MSTMHLHLDAARRAQLSTDPHEYVRADQIGTAPEDVVRSIRRLRSLSSVDGLKAMLGALSTHVAAIVASGYDTGMDAVLASIDAAHIACDDCYAVSAAREAGMLE